MKPNFFMIGSPKSATTSLYEYLKSHPDISLVPKELSFYNRDLRSRPFCKLINKQLTYDDEEEYFKLFDSSKKIRGEVALGLMTSKVAPELIKNEIGRDVKILISIRNPVDMLYSLHGQWVLSGEEKIKDFRKAIEVNSPGESTEELIFTNYKDYVKYDERLSKWIEIFGRENVKVVIFEEFKEDNEKVFKEILDFLEVDNTFKPDFKIINPHQVIRNSFIRDLGFFMSKHSPKFLKRFINSLIPVNTLFKYNIKEVKREELDEDLRRELLNEFMPNIKKFEKMINKDLSRWYK